MPGPPLPIPTPNPTPSSCIPKPPFIQLDPNGQPAILNYNLPQSSCISAQGYLKLNVTAACFKTAEQSPPAANLWDTIADSSQADLVQLMNDDVLGVASPSPVFTTPHYFTTQPIVKAGMEKSVSGSDSSTERKSSVTEDAGEKIVSVDTSDIVKQLERGRRPIIKRGLSGRPKIYFMPRPKTPKPTLAIVFHYKMCSYLGNYGAGKTLKSFSLLPGEKTTISLRSYKHTEETKKRSENVLDSFSQSSADELETFVSELIVKDRTLDIGLELSIKTDTSLSVSIPGLGSGTVGASTGFTTTLNTHIANHSEKLNTALSKHTEQSAHNRSVEVNTESSFLQITGSEESTVRQIQNINQSRVQNFVFRQLNQEYFTITYLDDISFVYSNGYPESNLVVGLSNIDELLTAVLEDGAAGTACAEIIKKVREDIFAKLCSIKDYQGNTIPFIECFTETVNSCCSFTDPPITYTNKIVRKRADLSQTFNGITVPGIILKVQNNIIPTEAIIVEALLGQGEALDCYNMKLQDEAVIKAQLDNVQQSQQIAIIDNITPAEKQAEHYKEVFFKPCCDVPQNCCGGGCGCDCAEKVSPKL